MAEDDQMANVKFQPGKKFGEWVIKKRLDEGGFGQVYLVENGKKEKGALKAESNEVEGGSAIKLETMILKQLNKNGPVPHIPTVYHAAKRNKYCYMVMMLLGDNLKHLKTDQPKERFTRGTWSRVGIQCLYSLKYLHDCGFIHRDIKPQNFVMGHPEDGARSRMVHILDFGLARPFASFDEKRKKWVARKARGSAEFRGTLRYTSPNVHLRKEQGRVDDVWSLLFVLIELNGGLPWQTEKERDKVEQMKMSLDNRTVMQNMPICMGNILPHLHSLDYYQRPDYHLFFKSLWQVMLNEKITPTSKYDWESPEQEENAKKFKPADWEKPEGPYFSSDPIGINGPPEGPAANSENPNNDGGLKSGEDKSKSNSKPAKNWLQVSPSLLSVQSSGGTVKFTMKNEHFEPIVYKVKISNVENYRVNPVFGIIQPKSSAEVEVVRTAGAIKIDRIVVQFGNVTKGETSTDAQKVFSTIKDTDRLTVPISAVNK